MRWISHACRLLAAGAAALALLSTSPARATVTFNFYETCFGSNSPGLCSPLPQPVVLMSITLSAATESGSASWMSPLAPPGPQPAPGEAPLPVVTDPAFVWQAYDAGEIAGPGFDYISTGCLIFCNIGPYDITWDAVAGSLDAVSIDISGNSFTVGPGFGLSGGVISTDDDLGGCDFSGCYVYGFWQDAPEPGSMPLLLTALVGLGLLRLGEGLSRRTRCRRRRPIAG